jgi:hypothetical protein
MRGTLTGQTPTLAVITSWKNRAELRASCAANAELFNRMAAEVIVVNCGGEDASLRAIMESTGIQTGTCVSLPVAAFNRALANNIGASLTAAPVLWFLDADIVANDAVLRDSLALLERERCFVSALRVRETGSAGFVLLPHVAEHTVHQDFVFKDGCRARIVTHRSTDGTRYGSGLLFVKRRDFVAAGGFDSSIAGWGFEDLDLIIRLQVVAEVRPLAVGEVLHLTHSDDSRTVDGMARQVSNKRNMQHAFQGYSRGFGNGTYLLDVNGYGSCLRPVWRSTDTTPTASV